MQYHEYCVALERDRPDSQRRGQWAFNLLHEVRPDLADEIHGTFSLDPFYRDENIQPLLEWLAERW